MCNYKYSIALVTFAIISVAVDPSFAERKPKLRFRPSTDWFANMQPADDSPNSSEQSDQPADSQFQDFYVEDYEPEGQLQFAGGNKFARNPAQAAVFQSLCPTKRTIVKLTSDFFEYRPNQYEEVECSHPFGKNSHMQHRNKVCSARGFSCIQQYREVFISRRAIGSDCWEVGHKNGTISVPSGCECMWPKHIEGDIMTHH